MGLECDSRHYSLGRRHGLKYFFPYLWGDGGQILADLAASLRGRIVAAPRPGGMATFVQGLGALLFMALSWLIRFCLWRNASPAAPVWRAAHECSVWLLIVYFHRPWRYGLAAFWGLATARCEKITRNFFEQAMQAVFGRPFCERRH